MEEFLGCLGSIGALILFGLVVWVLIELGNYLHALNGW
jgi:hypothetical protein